MEVDTTGFSPSAFFQLNAASPADLQIPFAGVGATSTDGDLAFFTIPERRWDIPIEGTSLNTPESLGGTPRSSGAMFSLASPPTPGMSLPTPGAAFPTTMRGYPAKRARFDTSPASAKDAPPANDDASPLSVLGAQGGPSGADQVTVPSAAQASSLSQMGLSNIYSTSGFDTLAILARIYSRPSPKINLGPIDCSSSFIVVDATKEDYPIVFCSENFTALTGYGLNEVLGKNCRFLQAPDGKVRKGSVRRYVDNNVIYQLKRSVELFQEAQFTQINYKKGGSPFVNMITLIPLTWDSDEVRYFVGFQVDLEDQSRRILKRMFEGTYFFPLSRARVGKSIAGPSIVELGPDGEMSADKSKKRAREEEEASPNMSLITSPATTAGVFAKPFPYEAKATLAAATPATVPYASPPTLSLAQIQQIADPVTAVPVERPGIFKTEPESPAYAASSVFAPSPSMGLPSPSAMGMSPLPAPSPVLAKMPIMGDAEDVDEDDGYDEDEVVEEDEEETDDDDEEDDMDLFEPEQRANKASKPVAKKVRAPAPSKARATAKATTSSSSSRRQRSSQPAEDLATTLLHPHRLAETQTDFTFILSSRGIFLYATAQGCKETVGYETDDLVGRTLSDFIHPHDLPSVARELRACKPGHPITAVFRFKRREPIDGVEYVWVETAGHKYELDNRKRTKCFVLSAREKVVDMVVPSISSEDAPILDRITVEGESDDLKWSKLTLEGLVLYASAGLSRAVEGTTFYARKIWDVLDKESGAVAREKFAELKRLARLGETATVPYRFPCRFQKGKTFVPAVIELHSVGTYPACAVFAAVETVTSETKQWIESLQQPQTSRQVAPAAASATDWSLLQVRDQSSLQHKQNWLRAQNKKLFDSLAELVSVEA